MKLRIRNLGPIHDADLELGDITIIFGPPNTGKTYTLKALYASTLMLDDIAREFELQRILDETVKDFPSIADITQVFGILTIIYNSGSKLDNNKADLLREGLRNFIGIDELDWNVDEDIISVTLRSRKSINLGEILKTRANSLWGILPLSRGTEVMLGDFPSISEIVSLVTRSMGQLQPFRKSFEDESQDIHLTLSISFESKTDGVIDVISEIIMSCGKSSPLLDDIEKILKNIEKTKIKKLIERLQTIEDIYNLIDFIRYYFYLKEFYFLLRSYIKRQLKIVEPIREVVGIFFNEFVGDLLRTVYSELLDLQAVRFVPFGRSSIICQLEYLSKEPFLRTKDFMQSFYGSDILLYSYISWLSKGRAKIAERIDNDELKELINLFTSVLQGRLAYDKTQGLVYSRFGHSGVPIKWASALAGEVTGIFLPMLTAPPKSCIIIEEPESQLHYSAHILMALTLAGLSSKYNYRLIFSTHSDLLALTLAYIKDRKPNKEEIIKLAREMLKMQKIQIRKNLLEPLAEYASKANNLNIKFYYYGPTRDGVKVSEKKADEVIRSIPSLTDVIDNFASWALSLGGDGLAQDERNIQRE